MSVVDQDIRDWVIQTTSASVALNAGAGSGKTSVLVARLITLLRGGTHPSRIAAMTFTEKAAGEMEERVRDALEELAAKGDNAAQLAIAQISSLNISTIHSFCHALLMLEALESNWTPASELMEAEFGSLAVEDAYSDWLRDLESDLPNEAMLLHDLVSNRALRQLAGLALTYRDLTPRLNLSWLDWELADQNLHELCGTIHVASRACSSQECKLLQANQGLLNLPKTLARFSRPQDRVALAMLATQIRASKTNLGRAQDWPQNSKPTFVIALKAFDAWRAELRTTLHGVVVSRLCNRFVPYVLEVKRREGLADFDDLLFMASELLKTKPDARARLSQRYDAILVDEVQDTDPIQAEVAALLSRPSHLTGAWNAVAPRPGGLFAVGDPKQSIYRFRRADVETWRELSSTIQLDGYSHALQVNFRSVPAIVDWVNHTFAELPEFQPQVAARTASELAPIVLMDLPDPESNEDPDIDAMIRHLLDLKRRRARVTDRSTGELREVVWADFMVLLPAWTSAQKIQDMCVAAGIPASVDGGNAFFQREEVRACLAALRALDEVTDYEATVFALRALWGFDHEALMTHRRAGGFWHYTHPDQPAGPVSDALAALNALHRKRERRSLVRTLDEVLTLTHTPAVWALMTNGTTRLANVEKVRALIRELEKTATSTTAVIQSLQGLARDSGERDLPVHDTDTDAIRITTVFKAKGLESPIVLLVRAKRMAPRINAHIDRDHGEVTLQVANLEPDDWEEARDVEKRAYMEERRRWMYVACTRARDQLVIIRTPKSNLLTKLDDPRETDIPRGLPPLENEYLHDAQVQVAQNIHVQIRHRLELPAPTYEQSVFGEEFATLRTELDKTPVLHTSWPTEVNEAILQGRALTPEWRSVGQLAHRSKRPVTYEHGVGAAGGTVVHQAMEQLNLKESHESLVAKVPALVRSLAASEGLDSWTTERCVQIVLRMLEHEVIDRARRAPEVWKETPFTFPDGNRIVSGIIDLCFPEDAERTRWVAVDWKSNLPPEGTPEREDYGRQLALYVKALITTIAPCEHVEAILVGPHPQLAADSPYAAVLEVLDERLTGLVVDLLERGMPAPEVDVELGNGVFAIGWPRWKKLVALDQPADAFEGLDDFAMIRVQTNRVAWLSDLESALVEWFPMLQASEDISEAQITPDLPTPDIETLRIQSLPGVQRVDPVARVVHAKNIPREELIELVSQGWMVIRS